VLCANWKHTKNCELAAHKSDEIPYRGPAKMGKTGNLPILVSTVLACVLSVCHEWVCDVQFCSVSPGSPLIRPPGLAVHFTIIGNYRHLDFGCRIPGSIKRTIRDPSKPAVNSAREKITNEQTSNRYLERYTVTVPGQDAR
jgi:hypothetical protein